MAGNKMENLIQVDAVERQLDALPPQFRNQPQVHDLLKNKELDMRIADIAVNRMEVNLEDIIMSCGNLFFHPLAKKLEDSAILRYTKEESQKICHGEMPSVIHFHGPYLGFLSGDDDAINKTAFFQDGIPLSCAVGADGIHCRNRQWQYFRMPWTDAFYDKLKKEKGIPTLKNVKAVKCDVNHPGNGKKRQITCEIDFMNGRETYKNVFNEVGCEYYKNYQYLYANMNDKNSEIYPIFNEFPDEGVYCTIFERNLKGKPKKRILTCFKHLI